MKAKGVKGAFIKWRDSRAHQPRSADYGIQVLKRLLSWALYHELIDKNPAADIETLDRCNRADQIVDDEELAAVLSYLTPHAQLAIRLLAATGMRRGDLAGLRWDHLKLDVLHFPTRKSNGITWANVPLVADARAVIAELEITRKALLAANRLPSTYLLTSHLGTPWSPDGLSQAFIRAAKAAGVKKRLNDLRGTAATRFVMANQPDERVADIMGWEPSRVRAIKKRYVDDARVMRSVADQIDAQVGQLA